MDSASDQPTGMELEILDLLRMGPESTEELIEMLNVDDAIPPSFDGEPLNRGVVHANLSRLAYRKLVSAYRESGEALDHEELSKRELPDGSGEGASLWWKLTGSGRVLAESLSDKVPPGE